MPGALSVVGRMVSRHTFTQSPTPMPESTAGREASMRLRTAASLSRTSVLVRPYTVTRFGFPVTGSGYVNAPANRPSLRA